MNRITFDKPIHIDEVREHYDFKKVSLLTKPNLYPMIEGVEFSGNVSFVLEKRRVFPIKRKMDAHIASYENAMLREWKNTRSKLQAIKNKLKDFKKLDYNNAQTIDRIARIPSKYKKQFIEVGDKYNLNLAILDKIVLNPTLLVNARYDSRKNLMELNPDYLKQHGMIRIGDSGELISETAKTFIHEFGHAYWYNSLTEEDRRHWQSLSRFFERKELTGNMEQYVVGEKKRFDGSTMYSPYYTHRDDPFVSVYARFNEREDWAECFLYYKVAPKTLARIDPKKYAFMEDKIGSKIEKDIAKVEFEPIIADPHKTREQVTSELDKLKAKLSHSAREHIVNVFNLGRQKGVYYTKAPYDPRLSAQDKKDIQDILDRNDEFLNSFMDDVNDQYDDVFFTKTPTGMIESERQYADISEFDGEFDGVMDNEEHRLSIYAINGLTLGLMAGMIGEIQDEFGGGYWHTSADDRVCDGCDRLDGQWMSFDEFDSVYGQNDCDGNCRCGELFEPSEAPTGMPPIEEEPDMSLPALAMERMVKTGQNAYSETGLAGTTVRETHPELDKPDGYSGYSGTKAARYSKSDKIVAVDYHGTLMIDNKPNLELINKLKEYKNAGYHIIVFTSGITRNPSILNGINVWLQENKVPYDEVWQRQGKPDADIYIDDKSFNPTKEDLDSLEVEPKEV